MQRLRWPHARARAMGESSMQGWFVIEFGWQFAMKPAALLD
jgi:hypothetical protein